MIAGKAYAKLNLGLRVGARRDDGFHSVGGIFQSIDIVDSLQLTPAEVDGIASSNGGPVIDTLDNLAFRAVAAVRREADSTQPVAMTLEKTIPIASGLGGGSADAAAALVMAGRFFDVDIATLHELAPQLGSDVPFCLTGGTARVSGRGETVEPLDLLTGFAVAVVVPPVEISTPAAFRQWDEMGERTGLRIAQNQLPPVLRGEGDLVNDLYPAATVLAPGLDDWRAELENAWGRPVMLSGSGPSLFAFFVDHAEAASALGPIPRGSRFAEACDLTGVGWAITDSEQLLRRYNPSSPL